MITAISTWKLYTGRLMALHPRDCKRRMTSNRLNTLTTLKPTQKAALLQDLCIWTLR
jgi:hypothetical protein